MKSKFYFLALLLYAGSVVYAQEPSIKVMMNEAHASVTYDLKAPNSAIFRSKFIKKSVAEDGSTFHVVCGEIN